MRHLEIRLRTIAALALAAACAACTSAGHSETAASGVFTSSEEIQGDPLVERELEVLRPRVSEEGGARVLEFELRNRSAEKQSFAYSLEWSDRADKRVGPQQRMWTNITLEAGASAPIRVQFPSPRAECWRLLAVRPDGIRW
jgi:hypothetical protein